MDVSLRDAAKLFRVSEPTVIRWVEEEGLPGVLINGRYVFNRVDLLEWAGREKLPVAPEVAGAAKVPVDLYIPGCPPHPLTILDGLLRLLGRLEDGRIRKDEPAPVQG